MITYEPSTGLVYWTARKGGRRFDRPVGSKNSNGYLSVGIDWKYYQLHRLIWLYMTGKWPVDCIDHKDGIRTNNAWNNLREASRSENNMNVGPKVSHGLKGASYHKPSNMWVAQIRVKGEKKHIGYFATSDEAHNAYVEAAKHYHGEFAKW